VFCSRGAATGRPRGICRICWMRSGASARAKCAVYSGFAPRIWARDATFLGPARAASIQAIEGFTWDCLAQAEVALAASGTVTIEAALLGSPW